MKAVFLDRDGVVNENLVDHVKRWSEFRFLPGALEAIARLSRYKVMVFIITNQAIISRGIVSRQTVDAINSRMLAEIRRRGGRVDEVTYCPHRPEDHCHCRKPQPGLLLNLAHKYRLDLREAIVIGDALTDIQAGASVGCDTILVMTGRGQQQLAVAKEAGLNGFRVAADLSEAVDLVAATSDSAD